MIKVMLKREQILTKLRVICAIFISFFITLLLTVAATNASELTQEQVQEYCQSTGAACYLDLNGSINDPCSTKVSDIHATGTQSAEIVWNGLMSMGFTKEQAAGIMGNMAHESNYYNPVQWEGGFSVSWEDSLTDTETSYGIGLIQFSGGRRTGLLNYIITNYPDLVQYYKEKNTYGPGDYSVNGQKLLEMIGVETYRKIVEANLEYLKIEMEGSEKSNYEAFKSMSDTPENAALAYRAKVERGGVGTESKRAKTAREIYDNPPSSSSSSSSSSTSTTSGNGSNTTIIGDSLTVGISKTPNANEIKGTNLIDGLEEAYVDAKVSRQWNTGVDILKDLESKNELKNNIVFALGTNSTGLTKNQVEEVLNIAGDTRQVYFITNITNQGADKDQATNTTYANNNTLFENAAAEHSNVKVINFAGKIINNKAKYYAGTDNVHPNDEGDMVLRDMIVDALNGSSVGSGGLCGNGGGSIGEGNGDLSKTAIALAWPLGTPIEKTGYQPSGLKGIASPAYAEALMKIYGHMGEDNQGLACNQFVATVVRYSGVDPDYTLWNAATQLSYLSSSPKWQEVPFNGDTSVFRPGDIGVKSGHVFIFAEDTDGVLKRVQASHHTETGMVKDGLGSVSYLSGFRYFRFIGN